MQGTINGYGERCGNANLCSIIPDLELKLKLRCLPEGKLQTLSEVSHFVAEVANLAPDEHLAYVGKHAFAHKGGIHVAAMRRTAQSYQHIDPELVGNEMARRRQRAVRAGKSSEQGGGIRDRHRAGRQARRRARRDQDARGSGLRVRGRRSFRRHDDEAARAEVPGAVRADRLHGDRRASARAAASFRKPPSKCACPAPTKCSIPPPRGTAL